MGLPVLVVLPLNGLGAINGEIKANTLELIFLTRLTAFRIVVGKWLAIFVQCLLFICAVLPYLVLRYFIGGINLAAELEVARLDAARGFGGALRVLHGAFRLPGAHRPRRGGSLRSCCFSSRSAPGGELFGRGVVAGRARVLGRSRACHPVRRDRPGADAGGGRGADRAARPRTIPRSMRLLAAGGFLVALAVSFLAAWFARRSLIIAFVIAVLVCLVGLCEEPRWVPSCSGPSRRRLARTRWPDAVLYPGWYTAVPFTLLMFAAFGWLLAARENPRFPSAQRLVRGAPRHAAVSGGPDPLVFARERGGPPFYFGRGAASERCWRRCCVLVCDNALGTSLKTPGFLRAALGVDHFARQQLTKVEVRFYAVAITTAASLLLLAIAVLRAWAAGAAGGKRKPATGRRAARRLPTMHRWPDEGTLRAVRGRGCRWPPRACGCPSATGRGAARAATGKARAWAVPSISRTIAPTCRGTIHATSTGRLTRARAIIP